MRVKIFQMDEKLTLQAKLKSTKQRQQVNRIESLYSQLFLLQKHHKHRLIMYHTPQKKVEHELVP